MTRNRMNINPARLEQRVHELARFTEAPPYTRRSFTDTYTRGRRWLADQFRDAGLHVAMDAAGNLSGRLPGTEPGLGVIALGSHTDTVVGGGRFDGILGVLAALEVIQSTRERGIRLRHTVEVIDFLAEEPSDYGLSCIGSGALVGALTADMLEAVTPAGETLREGNRRMGGNPEALTKPLRTRDSLAAFIELHIEQGRVLEDAGKDIGIVTHIVGIQRYVVTITGGADHAGTTPMHLRNDALVGAAYVVQTAERMARAWPTPIVATVGQLTVSPNATNVVPGEVQLNLEVRSADKGEMQRLGQQVLDGAAAYLHERGLELTFEHVADGEPTVCAPLIRDPVRAACATTGHSFMELPSGAGHDAAFMAEMCPAGMIFIPCRDGRSHSADEWADPSQMAAGAEVLYETVMHLERVLPT